MPYLASALLDFILRLLRDPQAAEAFAADPRGTLEQAGLRDVTPADLDAVVPVVLDRVTRREDGGDATGGVDASVVGAAIGAVPATTGTAATPADDGEQPAAVDAVVPQLQTLVATYTYNTTLVDDRDTFVDASVDQRIWAGGDVDQVFDMDPVVAAGGVAVDGDVAGPAVVGDGAVAGDGNTVGSPDSSVVDRSDNSDNSVVDRSDNSDNSVVDRSDNSDNSVVDRSDNSDNSVVDRSDNSVDNSVVDRSDNSVVDSSDGGDASEDDGPDDVVLADEPDDTGFLPDTVDDASHPEDDGTPEPIV